MTADTTEAVAPPPPPPARPRPRRAHLAPLIALLRWLGPGMPPKSAVSEAPPAPAGAGPLQRLATDFPLPTWTPVARTVILLVAVFVVWAALARIDEVAVAPGDVVPEGKVKEIQHLEGGIVRDIYVAEGAEVREGQPLIQLELPVTALNRAELQVRIDGLKLQAARLQAEVSGAPLVFPTAEAARQPQLVSAERRSYEARRSALDTTVAVLGDQIDQKRAEVEELQTRQRSLSTSLKLAHERLAMSDELIKSGLTARMDHVQLQGQVEDMEGQLATVRASIPRAAAALSEAQERIAEEKAKFVRTSQGDLATVQLDIARNSQLLTQATDQQSRTQITSPIDGIVKNLHANTIGGVVRAGEPIMEIVPINERLQIEARLSPLDRGYVHPGQRATVKVSAYDYSTYGALEGKVLLVAPDTTVAQGGNPGQDQQQASHRVVVQTARGWLGDAKAKHNNTAGMQTTVEIHTGTRTVLHYLVEPVLKLQDEAFRER